MPKSGSLGIPQDETPLSHRPELAFLDVDILPGIWRLGFGINRLWW